MVISVDGILPVGIKLVVGNENLVLQAVRLQAITGRASLAAQVAAQPGELPEVVKMCARLQLLAEDGETAYPVTYAQLVDSSDQNLDYLFELKAQLDAKERAAS